MATHASVSRVPHSSPFTDNFTSWNQQWTICARKPRLVLPVPTHFSFASKDLWQSTSHQSGPQLRSEWTVDALPPTCPVPQHTESNKICPLPRFHILGLGGGVASSYGAHARQIQQALKTSTSSSQLILRECFHAGLTTITNVHSATPPHARAQAIDANRGTHTVQSGRITNLEPTTTSSTTLARVETTKEIQPLPTLSTVANTQQNHPSSSSPTTSVSTLLHESVIPYNPNLNSTTTGVACNSAKTLGKHPLQGFVVLDPESRL